MEILSRRKADFLTASNCKQSAKLEIAFGPVEKWRAECPEDRLRAERQYVRTRGFWRH